MTIVITLRRALVKGILRVYIHYLRVIKQSQNLDFHRHHSSIACAVDSAAQEHICKFNKCAPWESKSNLIREGGGGCSAAALSPPDLTEAAFDFQRARLIKILPPALERNFLITPKMDPPRFLCKWNESESQRIPNYLEIFSACVLQKEKSNFLLSFVHRWAQSVSTPRFDCAVSSTCCRRTHPLGKSKQTLLPVLIQRAVHGYCNASCGKGLFVYVFSCLWARIHKQHTGTAARNIGF
jgi:hypothetical protein